MNKILNPNQLAKTCKACQKENKTIALCYGLFDFLHLAHTRLFKVAKSKASVLIVIIKDNHEAHTFSATQRAEALSEIKTIDYISIISDTDLKKILTTIKPDIFVTGSESTTLKKRNADQLSQEKILCDQLKIPFHQVSEALGDNTESINAFYNSFSTEQSQYLNFFKSRHTFSQLKASIDQLSKLKVLIIGDSILDEYRYCNHLGSSSKDTILTVKHNNSDLFAGGVLAIANHVAQYTQNVELLTIIGDDEKEQKFIQGQLNPTIKSTILTHKNAKTLRKIKYIESNTLSKIFGVYMMENTSPSQQNEDKLIDQLKKTIKNYDLIITADFGHDCLTDSIRHYLTKNAPFLAINTQANAGNNKGHTISQYSSADYVSISEPELRLDANDNQTLLRPLCINACQKMDAYQFAVTSGAKGSSITQKDGPYFVIPALKANAIDRIGSGDAFFAITSLLAANKTHPEMVGLIGNAVGALAVEIVGNKEPVSKMKLNNYLSHLLDQ